MGNRPEDQNLRNLDAAQRRAMMDAQRFEPFYKNEHRLNPKAYEREPSRKAIDAWAARTHHIILTTEEHEALLKAAERSKPTTHENPFRTSLSRIDKTGNY